MQEAGLRPLVPGCLEALAAVASAGDDPTAAALLLGAAEALRERLGLVAGAPEQERADRTLATVRDTLDGTAFAAAHGAGRALDFNEAIERALAVA